MSRSIADTGYLRRQPEEYHSAAMQHLESFLGSMPTPDNADSGGALEELQAVLLLAGFALLRPVGELKGIHFSFSHAPLSSLSDCNLVYGLLHCSEARLATP